MDNVGMERFAEDAGYNFLSTFFFLYLFLTLSSWKNKPIKLTFLLHLILSPIQMDHSLLFPSSSWKQSSKLLYTFQPEWERMKGKYKSITWMLLKTPPRSNPMMWIERLIPSLSLSPTVDWINNLESYDTNFKTITMSGQSSKFYQKFNPWGWIQIEIM